MSLQTVVVRPCPACKHRAGPSYVSMVFGVFTIHRSSYPTPQYLAAPRAVLVREDDLVPPDRPRIPPSRHIADDLRRRIAAGEWQPRQQLPSNRALAAEYGTTPRTVSKALRVLEDEGLVEIAANWGTFRAGEG
jgi:DNA-binding transcriptional ArsR family regulator